MKTDTLQLEQNQPTLSQTLAPVPSGVDGLQATAIVPAKYHRPVDSTVEATAATTYVVLGSPTPIALQPLSQIVMPSPSFTLKCDENGLFHSPDPITVSDISGIKLNLSKIPSISSTQLVPPRSVSNTFCFLIKEITQCDVMLKCKICYMFGLIMQDNFNLNGGHFITLKPTLGKILMKALVNANHQRNE